MRMRRILFTLLFVLSAFRLTAAAPNKNINKEIKAQVKALTKEGWKASLGTPTLEEQAKVYVEYKYNTEEDGTPMYIIATVAKEGFKENIAYAMASQAVKQSAVKQISDIIAISGSGTEQKVQLGRGKILLRLEKDDGHMVKVMLSVAYNRKECIKRNEGLVKKM